MTYVRRREAIEHSSRHTKCKQNDRQRILRRPTEARIHRVLLLSATTHHCLPPLNGGVDLDRAWLANTVRTNVSTSHGCVWNSTRVFVI